MRQVVLDIARRAATRPALSHRIGRARTSETPRRRPARRFPSV